MIRSVQTELFAVIGNPVKHSLSPAMMNAVLASLRIPAVYLALQVDDIDTDLETLSRMGFRGLSVTLPHKEAAFGLAWRLDETAEDIRAVNTLRRADDGRWEGRNTDWLGAVRALEQATGLAGKRAVVIGAGGAARAVVYGLLRAGAAPVVANRSRERGEALARGFGCGFLPLEELGHSASAHRFDVVVQCTSAGLAGTEASPALVPQSFFRPGMVVMDTVYRPRWTPFALAAREAGCVMVPGMDMLLHQGVAQLEWWLGRGIPPREGVQVMRDALERALEHE